MAQDYTQEEYEFVLYVIMMYWIGEKILGEQETGKNKLMCGYIMSSVVYGTELSF